MTDIFKNMVVDAGIPTTEDQLKTEWQAVAVEENSPFNNDSDYSPLWRLITGLVTVPALWLINLMITNVLPNFFVKHASGIYLDLLSEDRAVTRKLAVAAQGTLQFSRTETVGELLVPAGTVVQSASINGVIYRLGTLDDATFLDAEADIDIAVQALEAGEAYNLAAGYYVLLAEPLPGVTGVTNLGNWLTLPGANEETDDELRDRAQNQFNAVNQFHTDAVYLSLITSYAGLKTKNVWFEGDAPRGPGTANAHILLDVGVPSPAFLSDVQQYIMDQGNHGHGDDMQVVAIPETQHNLTYDYWELPGLAAADSAQLATDVDAFIRAAFRENQSYSPTLTLPWSKFSFSRLAQELHSQFPHLLSVNFANADIDSALEIPRINSLAGTLN